MMLLYRDGPDGLWNVVETIVEDFFKSEFEKSMAILPIYFRQDWTHPLYKFTTIVESWNLQQDTRKLFLFDFQNIFYSLESVNILPSILFKD